MPTCAYCGELAPATREHIWPEGLHRRLLAANAQQETAIWLRRIDRELKSEPTIKDVCDTCNNVTLGRLDDYVCDLFDKQFVYIPQRGESVSFIYEYHYLKRWLLKVSFNSARLHASFDQFALEALKPYILGRDDHLGRCVRLYLNLSYPVEIPATDLFDPSMAPFILSPLENRIGQMHFDARQGARRFGRCI